MKIVCRNSKLCIWTNHGKSKITALLDLHSGFSGLLCRPWKHIVWRPGGGFVWNRPFFHQVWTTGSSYLSSHYFLLDEWPILYKPWRPGRHLRPWRLGGLGCLWGLGDFGGLWSLEGGRARQWVKYQHHWRSWSSWTQKQVLLYF